MMMLMNIEKYWKKVVIFNYRYQVNQRRYYNTTITTTTAKITTKTTPIIKSNKNLSLINKL